MDAAAIAEAARLLGDVRRRKALAERLPEACRPASVAEAVAIQRAVAAAMNDSIVAWKIAPNADFGLMRGGILGSRLYRSPAEIDASLMPTLGIEAEIAFRCDRDFPARSTGYTRNEVEERVTALVGMEVVHSRFREATAVPVIERAADFMSNGGFVIGTMRTDWRGTDLAGLAASVVINGKPLVDRRVGGHVAKDPLLPLIEMVNVLRTGEGLAAGQIVTTGTFTGVVNAKAGDRVEVLFDGFGKAEAHFV
jgi:2-keto-4-pentenoate hydratase